MGYKGGLINRGSNGWYPDEVGNAQIQQLTDVESRGSAGEFSFAFGFNINNIVYLGASLDVQSISRKQTIYYSEYFDYAEGEMPNPDVMPYQLQHFNFGQSMQVNGSGIGAKFGVVVRPIEALRVGFSVHTPTYCSIAYRYEASLSSVARSVGSDPYGWAASDGYVYANERTPILQDDGEYRWTYTTPTRLLAGLSYSFGQYAVISVDYQYNAYRAVKLNYSPADTGYTNDSFRHNLKGTHTIRGGVEAKPLPWLSLRVGGGYRSRVLKSDFDFVAFSEPMEDSVWYASAGLGFRLSRVTSIDLAYQYRDARYSDYRSFYTANLVGENASPIYGLDIIKHNVALTFAFRF
jgi:long-subunit fatty acid transport protein